MTKKIWIIIGISLAVVITAVIAVLIIRSSGDAVEVVGDPAIDHVDPVLEDPERAAESLIAAVQTWRPAEQDSPADAAAIVSDRLSGKYAVLATDQEAPLPPQWQGWASSGDQVHAVAEVAPGSQSFAETDTEATVTVNVSRIVMHQDGSSTPLDSTVVDAHMVKEAGVWKLSDLTYRAAGPVTLR